MKGREHYVAHLISLFGFFINFGKRKNKKKNEKVLIITITMSHYLNVVGFLIASKTKVVLTAKRTNSGFS